MQTNLLKEHGNAIKGITPLKECFSSKNQIFYLFEKAKGPCQTLSEFILKQDKPLDLEVFKKLANNLLSTV